MDNFPQLVRGLIRMEIAEPTAYKSFAAHLKAEQLTYIDRLAIADEPLTVYRLQGGIKALNDILEFVEKPNAFLMSLEQQNLS
jgi:hypothetical protein